MNSPRRPKSRQALIKQRQQKPFIGREAQLNIFRSNLKQRPEEWCFLFSIWGQAGVGKSTLVKQLKKIAEEENFVTAHTDRSEGDVLEVMAQCAELLEKQGKKLQQFSERYKVYLQRKEEIEADPEAPQGLSGFLGKTIAKAGFGLAKQVPGSGVVTPFLDEEAIATQVGEWTSFVTKKARNKDEVLLVRKPIELLTPLFLKDLNEVAENADIVLFLDTCEHTSAFLDSWLREIFLDPEERYGTLPVNIILVLAGARELSRIDWEECGELIAHWHLEPFTDDEVRQYLSHKGIRDPKVVDEILRLSQGLPLWVETLAAENRDDLVSGNVLNNSAVEFFLKRINDPKLQRIALEASLSPLLNRDIITILDSEEPADELFDWLKSMPFVEERSRGGWSYHDIIRTQMLHKQRLLSPSRWIELHCKLAEYYDTLCNNFRLDNQQKWHDSSWQEYCLNGLYHHLCWNPREGVPKGLNIFLTALDRQFLSKSAQKCAEIIYAAGRSSALSEIQLLGNQILDGLKSFEENRYEDGISMLTLLLTRYNLDEESRTIALSWRGEAYRLIGLYDKSLQDFDDAISANVNVSWMIVSRSSTFRKLGRYKESLQDCNKAIELDSKDIKAFTSRGETYLRMKRYNEALQDFNHAVDLDPDDTWSLVSRGKAYQQMRQYKEAILDFNRVTDLNPNDSWALSNRGFVYRKQGLYEKAVKDYNRAIRIDPNNARLFASRAETYRLMKQYDQALEDFGSAISLKPNDAWAMCRRAETYLLLRQYEQSFVDFEAAITSSPDNDWRLFTYSLSLRAANYLEEASAKLSLAIQIAQNRYEQNLEDSRTALTLALYRLSDNDTQADILYKSVFSRNIQPALIWEAIRSLDDFLEVFPEHELGKSTRKMLLSKVKT
jgi:tetratricopeptide (TPR) repeat protein